MYKAATAKIRVALDGFSAGEVSLREDGLHVPISVSDTNGKTVATHAFVLRIAGDCTGLAYDEDGNVVTKSVISPDAAVGALEQLLAAFAKAASDPDNPARKVSIGDELLNYLVTIGLLPR